MVTSAEVTELPLVSTGKAYGVPMIVGADGQRYLVGQTQPGDVPSAGVAAALAVLFGGILLMSLAVEAVPGMAIAHYAYHLPWLPSFGIGVASAIGFNMVVDALGGGGAGAKAGVTLQPVG